MRLSAIAFALCVAMTFPLRSQQWRTQRSTALILTATLLVQDSDPVLVALQRLPEKRPELELRLVRRVQNSVSAFYNAGNVPGTVQVTVESYDSDAGTAVAIERKPMMISVWRDSVESYKGMTLMWWGTGRSSRGWGAM